MVKNSTWTLARQHYTAQHTDNHSLQDSSSDSNSPGWRQSCSNMCKSQSNRTFPIFFLLQRLKSGSYSKTICVEGTEVSNSTRSGYSLSLVADIAGSAFSVDEELSLTAHFPLDFSFDQITHEESIFMQVCFTNGVVQKEEWRKQTFCHCHNRETRGSSPRSICLPVQEEDTSHSHRQFDIVSSTAHLLKQKELKIALNHFISFYDGSIYQTSTKFLLFKVSRFFKLFLNRSHTVQIFQESAQNTNLNFEKSSHNFSSIKTRCYSNLQQHSAALAVDSITKINELKRSEDSMGKEDETMDQVEFEKVSEE